MPTIFEEYDIDQIELPNINTLLTPIPFEYVGPVSVREDLIKPSSAKDKDLITADEIDCERLVAQKAKSSKTAGKSGVKTPYSVAELKEFAKKAGMKSSFPKPKLVEALRERYCI